MAPTILLVDDQRDILRLLRSTLETLRQPDLEILEAPSGEDALLELGRHNIDLLVIDYLLPGMTGLELMQHVRSQRLSVKVILIAGATDRKARDEMLNAGAAAVFDKPIPLADFLSVVERSLGLDATIFPSEAQSEAQSSPSRFSDLLANFRQDMQADAVFLINDRGLVAARAGDLRDGSMEVSMVSALTAAFSAGLKVAKSNHQQGLNQYFVFTGGDQELILMPVDPTYSLLLAGNGFAGRDNLSETIQAMIMVRNELVRALRSMGATGELKRGVAAPPKKRKGKTDELPGGAPEPEMAALLNATGERQLKGEEMNAFWERAAEQHANRSTDPDAISYEEARKRGLTPDSK
jgi:CheY-like chemotaxis protein